MFKKECNEKKKKQASKAKLRIAAERRSAATKKLKQKNSKWNIRKNEKKEKKREIERKEKERKKENKRKGRSAFLLDNKRN